MYQPNKQYGTVNEQDALYGELYAKRETTMIERLAMAKLEELRNTRSRVAGFKKRKPEAVSAITAKHHRNKKAKGTA